MELEEMVREFETTELQTLLVSAGYRYVGERKKLLSKALNLIKFPNYEITMIIRQIFSNKAQYMNSFSALSDRNNGIHRNVQPVNNSSIHMPLVHMSPYCDRDQFLMNFMPLCLSHQRPLYYIDVKFKELPFYVKLYELLPPTRLFALPGENPCERNFSFCLTSYHVYDLQNIVNAKILMRIGLLNTQCEQDDVIPPNACIRINGIDISLPCPTLSRHRRTVPKHPLDITFAAKKNSEPNSVYISWVSSRPYVFAINIVQTQTTSAFLKYLWSKEIGSSELTKTIIKKQFQKGSDSDISTMSLKGSLICPMGKIKMKHPCRACTCDHFECFDGKLYFEMNENNPKWICPLCHKQASFENLFLDGLYLDIISKAPSDCIEVEFREDGSWTPLKQANNDISHNCVTVRDKSFNVAIFEAKEQIKVIDLE